MNPIRMTTDLKWLESHVRTICGGQLPPLVGPYAIPFLVSQLEGMQRHFTDGFTGWASVLSTVTDAVPLRGLYRNSKISWCWRWNPEQAESAEDDWQTTSVYVSLSGSSDLVNV